MQNESNLDLFQYLIYLTFKLAKCAIGAGFDHMAGRNQQLGEEPWKSRLGILV